MLLFGALVGSGELSTSSLVLFGIQIYYLSDAPVGVSWQLLDYYNIFDLVYVSLLLFMYFQQFKCFN